MKCNICKKEMKTEGLYNSCSCGYSYNSWLNSHRLDCNEAQTKKIIKKIETLEKKEDELKELKKENAILKKTLAQIGQVQDEKIIIEDVLGVPIKVGSIVSCRHIISPCPIGMDENSVPTPANAYNIHWIEDSNGVTGVGYYRNYIVEYFQKHCGFRLRNKSCTHELSQSYIVNHLVTVIGSLEKDIDMLTPDYLDEDKSQLGELYNSEEE